MLPFLTTRQQLAISAALLLLSGFLLVTSASIHYADTRLHNPFYFSLRHGMFAAFAVCCGALVAIRVEAGTLQRFSPIFLIVGVLGIVLVLIPGIGREVNGSQRWIPLGFINVQPSEITKLCLLVFFADYLARHRADGLRTVTILKPLGLLGLVVVLLMAEPDMGASVVLIATTFALLFVAGLPWVWVGGLAGLGVIGVTAAILLSPYRVARMTSFLDPWQHQFDSGYQLVQSLIAFGRGEVTGVGLGNSVQKLFYLPEAHTDFVFAVAAEEFGLLGVIGLVSLFVLLVGAMVGIARERSRAGDAFGAYFAWGAAVLFAVQALVNMGVNMGLMPTKGLTLPLVSYGGSSLVINCLLLGALWHLAGIASGATRAERPSRAARFARRTVSA